MSFNKTNKTNLLNLNYPITLYESGPILIELDKDVKTYYNSLENVPCEHVTNYIKKNITTKFWNGIYPYALSIKTWHNRQVVMLDSTIICLECILEKLMANNLLKR